MSKLEISKNKLIRLESELDEAIQDLYDTQKTTNGQPMNDKRNGRAWFRKMEQKENKCRRLRKEIEEQKIRVEKLEYKEYKREQGLNRNGSGLKLSVENIDRIKAEISNPDTKYGKATIKRYREYINMVESLANNKTPQIIQDLVKNDVLNEWKKYPNIFFIKELQKVAIVYVDGKVGASKKYPPKTERDKKVTKEIIEHIRSRI